MTWQIVDLSTSIESLATQVYSGEPPPLRSCFQTIVQRGFHTDVWVLGDHTGTHVDAPSHFVEGGRSIDEVAISACVGNGIVLDFHERPPRYSISKGDIIEALKMIGKEDMRPGCILLFYTGYILKAGSPESEEHPALSEAACEFLVSKKISAIGIDAMSPDRVDFPAHRLLLPQNICIYENLNNLEKVLQRDFIFVGAPIRLVGSSASPVRALGIIP